ncbi:MAG: biotin/lipoate A/B protein ligase family protein [Candidatus Thorarchaeota archaeon]
MEDKVRFIGLETHSAQENMAIDEAILLSLSEGRVPPTLRLYRWRPSAVSIGTFQSMNAEVDRAYCQSHGIDMVRRITGGGAVYHDYSGELTYSIILPRGHRLVNDDIQKSYEILCQGIVQGLSRLGVSAEFKPVNDIVVNGRKISGNAQTRRHNCLLQHGTILISVDVVTMFSVLKVRPEKITDKVIADVKQRVTSLNEVLGRDVGFEETADALRDGFASALSLRLVPGTLSDAEKELAARLVREKYSTDAWNLVR